MSRYKIAVFIGRFQPFHNGHLYSLMKCLDLVEKIVIGVGSSNVSGTEENPLGYEVRKEMIEEVVRKESLKNRVVKIVPIADFPSDDDWVEEVNKRVGEFDVVVGNNDWTNGALSNVGYEVYETGFHDRDKLEGARIREMLKQGYEEWKRRVPGYLVKMIDKNSI